MKVIALFFTVATFLVNSSVSTPKNIPKPIVVLELFTSEGCSSCPSADALLNSTIIEAEKSGKEIYALSFHVDYWNHLGWKDNFSSSQFSDRQRDYAAYFGSGSYTPQLVVNGNKEFVGSDKYKMQANLAQPIEALNDITLGYQLLNNEVGLPKIQVSYEVSGRTKNTEIKICLVQKDAVTAIQRGENSGRKLIHKNVVRVLVSQKINQPTGQMTLTIPKGISPKDCSIIAFTQINTHQITGANSIKSLI
jgi:hypothetical protein